jgi:hypothetical protein
MSRLGSSLLRLGGSSSRCASRLLAPPAMLRSPLPRAAASGGLLAQVPGRSFAVLAAVTSGQQHRCRSSPIAAAVVGQPAIVAVAAPLAATQQVRHKKGNRRVRPGKKRTRNTPHAGRGNYVWWQPLLPALALERVPHMRGKGRALKLAQQRKQQMIWRHAIRKEGQRRNKIFKAVKREKEKDKVRAVYREYGEMLRQRFLDAQEAAASSADGSTAEVVVDDGWRPKFTGEPRKLPARVRGWAGGTGRESRWDRKAPAETTDEAA